MSHLDDAVAPSEPICRFVFGKDYCRPSDKSVKHNAFMPNNDGETSVYRTVSLNDNEIADLGIQFVAPQRGKSIKGWADILAERIMDEGLRIEPKPNAHYRHANIVDWFDDKSRNMLIAQNLAAEAGLKLL